VLGIVAETSKHVDTYTGKHGTRNSPTTQLPNYETNRQIQIHGLRGDRAEPRARSGRPSRR
jgi:hypothetical protein